MKKKKKSSKTTFDNVFRTIVQKLPQLLIPFINEVFGTDYPENVPITQARNKHYECYGKIITDSPLNIKKCYS